MTIDDDQPDLEKYDELEDKKKRLHCWVLVRKDARDITESFFLEPTTGRRYEIPKKRVKEEEQKNGAAIEEN